MKKQPNRIHNTELHIYVHKDNISVNKGGRPKLNKDTKQKTITFSLPPKLYKSLMTASDKTYVPVSAIVRQAVIDYLKK